MRWDVAGSVPADGPAADDLIIPRLDVTAVFRVVGPGESTLPIYTLKLRGRATPLVTLGDLGGFRAKLKSAFAKATPPVPPEIADSPLAELSAKATAAKFDYASFERETKAANRLRWPSTSDKTRIPMLCFNGPGPADV